MTITWGQALGWRLRRHHLPPVGRPSVAEVVRRLGAVPAWSGDPEVAVGTRRETHLPGEVAEALDDGLLAKVFAYGGGTFLMTPEDAGTYLALRCASRMWEQPSWREHYGLEPDDWPVFRAVVRELLADGPMTRQAIAAELLARHPRFRRAAEAFSWTLLKPLNWQGDLCFGPEIDGEVTFQALAENPRWPGVPPLEEAGPAAIRAYLTAYGPATPGHLHRYYGEGLGAGRRRIDGWIAGLRDELAEVDVGGGRRLVLAEDVEELQTAEPSDAVRLLAGQDPWVRGPGTQDEHVVPPDRRALVTKGANLVLDGGRLVGTWKAPSASSTITVSWFSEAGPVPEQELATQTERLAALLDRPLTVRVETL